MPEELSSLVAVAIGIALRLAIPIGLTILVVWWLRRLDTRWQAESQLGHVQVVNADELARAPRCWETRNCPPEKMADCPAHVQPHIACWQVFRRSDGSLKVECLTCMVFRRAPVPQLQWIGRR